MLMVIAAVALVVAGCGDAKRKASPYQQRLDRLIHAHSDVYSQYYRFFKLNLDLYAGEVGCLRLVVSQYGGDELLVALHGCLDAAGGNASLAPLTNAQRAFGQHVRDLSRRYPGVYASYKEDFADLDESDEAFCIEEALDQEENLTTTTGSPLVRQDKTLVAIHACQDAANAAATPAAG